ncbi:CLUMA_CG010320, isoform A, partial [Clunio marinus]
YKKICIIFVEFLFLVRRKQKNKKKVQTYFFFLSAFLKQRNKRSFFITYTDFIGGRRKFFSRSFLSGNMLVNAQNEEDSLNGKINKFSESVETVQNILRYSHDDNSLTVTRIICEPGSKDGDNYMSLIKRVKVTVKANNNSEYRTSLIIKRQMDDENRRKLFRCDYAFKNEIAAYCHLIPVLKKFSNDNLPYPKCFFAGMDTQGEIIAMEDLKELGFEMANRTHGLDFEHCSLVLKELGGYHAISLAMKVVDPMKFFNATAKMHEVVFSESAAEFFRLVLDGTLNEAISSLSNFSNENGDLDKPIEILKRLGGKKLFDIMMNHVQKSDNKWKVVCHGDLWINNLMFHYHNSKLKHVKFVDLQTIRYTNLVCDILMLLYSSTDGSMRDKHMDRLIEVYRESLISTLREYLEKNYRDELEKLEDEFTVKSIMHELGLRSLYGLGTSLWVMPAVTFVSLSKIMGSIHDQQAHEEYLLQLQPKEYHTRVKDIVKEFYERGYFDNIFIDV